MSLVLLIGGARSGKSRLALSIARAQAAPVVFIATAEARDDEEMALRIEQHRHERPSSWPVIETLVELHRALAAVDEDACIVVDCLTLWTANMIERYSATEVEHAAGEAASLAARRTGPTIAVTNEVGLGLVPATQNSRSYRDLLGRVNSEWAQQAQQAYLVVAGRLLQLAKSSEVEALLR